MMKPICRAILPLLFALSMAQAAVPGAGLQTGESLRKWKSDMIAKHDSPAGFDLFYNYTGKPFDEKQQGYLFKFRSYDPELSRWTTFDPSGFPDGANNSTYVTNSPINLYDFCGLEGKKVAYIYAYTGDSSVDAASVLGVQNLVASHMEKMQQLDEKDPGYQYVSDGDYIDYGSISDPSQLNNFGFYDYIYVAAHGVYNNGQYTGVVRIGGQDYDPLTITAGNLAAFDYCGKRDGGLIRLDEVSGRWFFSESYGVEQYFLE